MAQDSAMLAVCAATGCALWRVYAWCEPAVTFGYSQAWEAVRRRLLPFAGACVRRSTGGGIVDHRDDLTYALAIPPSHAVFRQPAGGLYRALHGAIAGILVDAGFAAELAPCRPGACPPQGGVSVCFQAPEPFDVIDPGSGRKLAGAALRRCRDGILIQGSLDRAGLPGLTHAAFADRLGPAFAAWLALEEGGYADPLPDDRLQREYTRFRSAEWNRRR
jgi:lipoate-protein ligase A